MRKVTIKKIPRVYIMENVDVHTGDGGSQGINFP